MSATTRMRLDQLIVERGLAETRTRAQALLLAGKVRVGIGDAVRTDKKAGDLVDASVPIELSEELPYVSRGGQKLEAPMDAFAVDPKGHVCLDVGASTGGFTDLLLQRGAARVYALDVGRGQLSERLRRDSRVISLERTNARLLRAGFLPETVSLAVIDVSFISLALVLGPAARCFGPDGGRIVALVKPQFEAGKGRAPGGVVRDPAVHLEVLERASRHGLGLGLGLAGVVASPLLGPSGNREFFIVFQVPAGWAARHGSEPAPAAGPGSGDAPILPHEWSGQLRQLAEVA